MENGCIGYSSHLGCNVVLYQWVNSYWCFEGLAVPSEHWELYTEWRCVKSQKSWIFSRPAVRTSNLSTGCVLSLHLSVSMLISATDKSGLVLCYVYRRLWYSLASQWLGKSQYPTSVTVRKVNQWFERRRQMISSDGSGLSCSMPRIILGKLLVITCMDLQTWARTSYFRGAQI